MSPAPHCNSSKRFLFGNLLPIHPPTWIKGDPWKSILSLLWLWFSSATSLLLWLYFSHSFVFLKYKNTKSQKHRNNSPTGWWEGERENKLDLQIWKNKPDFLYLENAIVGENASGMPLVSVFPGENNIGNMPPFHGYLKLHWKHLYVWYKVSQVQDLLSPFVQL